MDRKELKEPVAAVPLHGEEVMTASSPEPMSRSGLERIVGEARRARSATIAGWLRRVVIDRVGGWRRPDHRAAGCIEDAAPTR